MASIDFGNFYRFVLFLVAIPQVTVGAYHLTQDSAHRKTFGEILIDVEDPIFAANATLKYFKESLLL